MGSHIILSHSHREPKNHLNFCVPGVDVEHGTLGASGMRIEALGTHGGEMPGCRATSFHIDGRLALDAGGLISSLSIEELCQLDHVLVTHSHLDHIKDLALMADLIIGRRQKPVYVHATSGTVTALKRHFFNNIIWPDFTAIPTREDPILTLDEIEPLRDYRVGDYVVRAVPVNHSVEATGFVVSGRCATIAFSGDTGPTGLFWQQLNRLSRLDVLFIEVSFPNSLQRTADVSRHFTPRTLDMELEKLNHDNLPVFIYHLKPAFLAVLEKEIAELGRPNLHVLHDGDVFVIPEAAEQMLANTDREPLKVSEERPDYHR